MHVRPNREENFVFFDKHVPRERRDLYDAWIDIDVCASGEQIENGRGKPSCEVPDDVAGSRDPLDFAESASKRLRGVR